MGAVRFQRAPKGRDKKAQGNALVVLHKSVRGTRKANVLLWAVLTVLPAEGGLLSTTALDPQGTRVSSVPRRIPIRSGRPRTAIQRCSVRPAVLRLVGHRHSFFFFSPFPTGIPGAMSCLARRSRSNRRRNARWKRANADIHNYAPRDQSYKDWPKSPAGPGKARERGCLDPDTLSRGEPAQLV